MCGIVGICSKSYIHERSWLSDGNNSIRHRGPDDSGEWWSPNGLVGFAHRRLSIIELSSAGHQPMHDDTGELVIVFNGEIYNHKFLRDLLEGKGHTFKTLTDTEVILVSYREWGKDCLSHLNGMFAFTLYDSRTQQIFMARDRAGEKPLFYSNVNGTLRFASELKALMADQTFQRHIDHEALDCYLTMGYVPGTLCILDGVNKLPPAHALSFDLTTGISKVWRYWHLPEYESTGHSDVELLDELEALLEDAVRLQLVADVPIGILLSGGVDSSLITAMAVRSAKDVKTFTVRFPGHGKYDETTHARLISNYFNTDHVELEGTDIHADLMLLLARQFDEPIVDSSMIPTYLVSQLIRRHCTVAIGGDGGDELFGGYPHYNRLLWLQQHMQKIPRFLRTAISASIPKLLPIGFKGRNYLQGLGADLEKDLPLIASLFDKGARRNLMSSEFHWIQIAESIRKNRIPSSGDLLQKATRMDFENYLSEDILVKVDRASMLNSLEIRAPFLDYRLIEFAFGKVASNLKTTSSSRKILLKRLCTRVLPPEFNQQRKQGFSIPLAKWLENGSWNSLFKDVLLGSDDSLFNKKIISRLFEGQRSGMVNSERLFALVLLEIWRKEYKVSFK